MHISMYGYACSAYFKQDLGLQLHRNWKSVQKSSFSPESLHFLVHTLIILTAHFDFTTALMYNVLCACLYVCLSLVYGLIYICMHMNLVSLTYKCLYYNRRMCDCAYVFTCRHMTVCELASAAAGVWYAWLRLNV